MVINTEDLSQCLMTVKRGDELTMTYTTKYVSLIWNITSQPPKPDSRDASPEPEFEEEMSPSPEFEEQKTTEPKNVEVKQEKYDGVDLTKDSDDEVIENKDEDDTPLKKKREGSTPRKAIPTKKHKSKKSKKDKKGDTSTQFKYKLGQPKANQPMSEYMAFIKDPTKKEIVEDLVNDCKKRVKNSKTQRSYSASMNNQMQTRVCTFIKEHNLDYTATIEAHNSKIVAEPKTDPIDHKKKGDDEPKTDPIDPKKKGDDAKSEQPDPKKKKDPKGKGPADDEKPKTRKRVFQSSDDEDQEEMVDVHTFIVDKGNYTTSSVSVKERDVKRYALTKGEITQDK
jgi:hypothetical protein